MTGFVASVDEAAGLWKVLAWEASAGGGSADDCGAGGVGVVVEIEGGGGASDMVWK